MWITDLCRVGPLLAASARKTSAKVKAPAPIPSAPMRKKLRRETPSQNRWLPPKIVSMVASLVWSGHSVATIGSRTDPTTLVTALHQPPLMLPHFAARAKASAAARALGHVLWAPEFGSSTFSLLSPSSPGLSARTQSQKYPRRGDA